MESKECNKCKVKKTLNEFGNIKRKTKTGISMRLKYRCKACETKNQKEKRECEKEADPEKYHQKWADYYAKTKEQNKLAKKNYLDIPENREKRRAYIRSYRKERKESDPKYKIFEALRKRLNSCLKKKTNSSKELLGCEINHYIKWIEFTMKEGMNWKNHGTYWHIDHIIPINSYDIENPDEAKKAFNWKNTWALEAKVNLSKSVTIIPELITEHTELLNTFVKLNINN